MGVVAKFRSVVGVGGDSVEDLTKQIDDARAAGIRGSAELEKLELARVQAESFDDAKSIDDKIARCRWSLDRLAAILEDLEPRLKFASSKRQRENIEKHQAIQRKSWPAFRAALSEAVKQQTKCIRERDDAVAEIGDAAASIFLQFLTYRGFLFEEFATLHFAAVDAAVAAPAAMPAPVAAVKPVPAMPAKPAVAPKPAQAAVEPASPVQPRRTPRRDKVAPNGRLVTLMRSGVELPDGTQGVVGDVVAMLATDAERLVMSGAADYHNAS
jgi:hypothetical protein